MGLPPHLLHPALPQPGQTIHWSSLYGASVGWAIHRATQIAPLPFLVIVSDHHMLTRLAKAYHFFNTTHQNILIFPGWETLPYDHFSSHPDIISERLETLSQLPTMQQGIVMTTMDAIMHPLPPQSFLQTHSLMLRKGETLSIEPFRHQLTQAGYRIVNQVYEHGELAIRGAIIDLFPMGATYPFRLELLDNEIDTIRTFSPETQRTLQQMETICLLPAKEFPLTEQSIEYFRKTWRNQFGGNPLQCPLYCAISEAIAPPGIEYYLPLFFEKTETLFDYLPQQMQVIVTEDAQTVAQTFWQTINTRYHSLCHHHTKPLIPPKQLFITPDALQTALSQYPTIILSTQVVSAPTSITWQAPIQPLPTVCMMNHATDALKPLAQFIQNYSGKILFTVESEGRQEMLLRLLQSIAITPVLSTSIETFYLQSEKIGVMIAPLEEGFILDDQLALIPEMTLHDQQVMQRRLRQSTQTTSEQVIFNLNELTLNEPVVHLEHGVGRYQGLETLTVGQETAEYMCITYQDNDRLFVPITALHLINRYTGVDPEQVTLNKLGSEQWKKTKKRAIQHTRDVAVELLHLYAKRAARLGITYHINQDHYAQFAAQFPFEETPDQTTAITQVLQDMTQEKPMDRVICGDVGFGKTEVAMRAAFIAVDNHKQVAILVPTTLLAQQHFETFCNRFANWPVHIEMISRFRSQKEISAILEKLHTGKIDILIGTHKLLQSDVKFQSLGLIIVDEEHRFGVKQKEKIKSLHNQTDMLTLTATPIPRTLNMTLSGIRDLSIIATPPAKRLAVKTFLYEYQPAIIQEAIQRELLRGGQVYFLHNEIETIQKQAEQIGLLVKQAKIGIAHGQMHERALEKQMSDFYHQRFNVLVCSTIIESGIDIPTANTMLINRADQLGIAQLHQLRGRVGRSHHQAYAYLLTPPTTQMNPDAMKRLEAITTYDHLGIGFTLSTHDLEIRGAGELLGEKQSGNMKDIGFTLYMDFLSRAIASLKAGKTPTEETIALTEITEINLHVTTLIPQDYLPDVPLRLQFYKRIASAKTEDMLNELQVEMIDRFGLLPEALKNLFAMSALKLKTSALGIKKIEANHATGYLLFNEKPTIQPEALVTLIQQDSAHFKMVGPSKLHFQLNPHAPSERINLVETILHALTAPVDDIHPLNDPLI